MERNETSNERKKCRKENKIRNRRRDLLAVWSRGLRQQPATHRVAVALKRVDNKVGYPAHGVAATH